MQCSMSALRVGEPGVLTIPDQFHRAGFSVTVLRHDAFADVGALTFLIIISARKIT